MIAFLHSQGQKQTSEDITREIRSWGEADEIGAEADSAIEGSLSAQ